MVVVAAHAARGRKRPLLGRARPPRLSFLLPAPQVGHLEEQGLQHALRLGVAEASRVCEEHHAWASVREARREAALHKLAAAQVRTLTISSYRVSFG